MFEKGYLVDLGDCFKINIAGISPIVDKKYQEQVKINQDLPFLGEAAGIFEVKKNPEVLWYEVVQTSGTQNVPPTAAAGFGSSNGGTLGTINIQKFVRVN